jgi:glycerol-3-phosphate acyltransferase PlsY
VTCSADKRKAKNVADDLDDADVKTYNHTCARNERAGVAELADAADLKSAGAILVGSSPTPGTSWEEVMPWLIVILGYLLGSIPTAHIAGRIFKKVDIRQVGDGNVGAQNAFRQLGAKTGVAVGIIDAGKGTLAILIAQAVSLSQVTVLLAGAAAVVGHNWPVFLGFRGGRGEATTIGVLLTTITQPMLILAAPAILTLVIFHNVVLASAVLFVPLPLVCWGLGVPGILIAYSIALPCLVGFTHFLRTRQVITPPA